MKNKIKYIHNEKATIALLKLKSVDIESRYGIFMDSFNDIYNTFVINLRAVSRLKDGETYDEKMGESYARAKLIKKRNKIYKNVVEGTFKDLLNTSNLIDSDRFKNVLRRVLLRKCPLNFYKIYKDGNPIGYKYSYYTRVRMAGLFEDVLSILNIKRCNNVKFTDIKVAKIKFNDLVDFNIEGKVIVNKDDKFDEITGIKCCDRRFFNKINKSVDFITRTWSNNFYKAAVRLVNDYNKFCTKYKYDDYKISVGI